MGCVVPGEIADLDAPLGRLAIAKIAVIAMGLEVKTGMSPFDDIDDPYALTLYEANIITGEIQGSRRIYNPYGNVTRAEMSAIVSRLRGIPRPTIPPGPGTSAGATS